MRVRLTSPDRSTVLQLDTPEPALVGPWLKAIFDDYAAKGLSSSYIPIEFSLEIS